jgi:hypothetical protein
MAPPFLATRAMDSREMLICEVTPETLALYLANALATTRARFAAQGFGRAR